MTATTAQRDKARQMLDAIRAGKTVFTRAPECWMVIGPAVTVRTGQVVTVTKASGETTQVQITATPTTGEKQGVSYTVADFRTYHAPGPGVPVLLATDAQVATIEQLLAHRARTGDGGGFMTMASASRESLARLTRAAASTYITSLREEY